MAKKQMLLKTRGMNRDLSVSAFSPEFSFENVNLRLITNDGNTTLSWVNEKSTAPIELGTLKDYDGTSLTDSNKVLKGVAIGTAVINNSLIIFSTTRDTNNVATDSTPDYIYKLEYNSTKTLMNGKILFRGDLGFSTSNPIETLVSYESSTVQKVYWTDFKNQPRLINIQASQNRIEKWNIEAGSGEAFDFIPTLDNQENVNIVLNHDGSGIFAPGVIQYCFTYYYKYGQQSNIAYISPLYYLGHSDRGASTEEKVTCSFSIDISNLDSKFDYLRLYSIQRTSLNSTPFVRLIGDFQLTSQASQLITTYSDNANLTLPIKTVDGVRKKILKKEHTAGTFTVTVNKASGTPEMTANSIFKILLYGDQHTISYRFTQDQINALRNSGYGDIPTLLSNLWDEINATTEEQIPISENSYQGLMLCVLNELISATSTSSTVITMDPSNIGFSTTWITKSFFSDGDLTLNDILADTQGTYAVAKDFSNDYFFHMQLYDNFKAMCRDAILERGEGIYNRCGFFVNGNLVFIIENNQSHAAIDHFIYSYADQNWYVTEGGVNDVIVQTHFQDIHFVDNGTTGSTVDPTELLYMGGYKIKVLSMAEKDNTLFLGNLKQDNPKIDAIQTYYDEQRLAGKTSVSFVQDSDKAPEVSEDVYLASSIKALKVPSEKSFYSYYSFLDNNSRKITTFKGGDTYRFGFQLQDATGKWSEPIFMEDVTNDKYPASNRNSEFVRLAYAEAEINLSVNSGFNDFKKIRPVVVFPTIADRNVVCQGVINPTVFNIVDREKNAPYAQASWFFRPYYFKPDSEDYADTVGSNLPFTHYSSLKCANQISINSTTTHGNEIAKTFSRQVEIQGSKQIYSSWYDANVQSPTSNTQFFVDQSIVTLNSPEIEFNNDVQSLDTEGLKLRIIGAIPITASSSSHSIVTGSNMLAKNTAIYNPSQQVTLDFLKQFGMGELANNVLNNNQDYDGSKKLVADFLWNDVLINQGTEIPYGTSNAFYSFLVHPWNRTGSLNNDFRPLSDASSLLKTKKLANLHYSYWTYYNTASSKSYQNIQAKSILTENTDITTTRLSKPRTSLFDRNYYSSVNKLLYNTDGYQYYALDSNGDITTNTIVGTAITPPLLTNPIQMKYKSTSHMVIELMSDAGDERIPIMPYGESRSNNNVVLHGEFPERNDVVGQNAFWGEKGMLFSQESISLPEGIGKSSESGSKGFGYLWLGELYKTPSLLFGGATKDALRANTWLIGGDEVDLSSAVNNKVTIRWTEGDTYYQRYDCLKTFAYTKEDPNQIMEILSFMCETHVNIDGRYDRHRGQLDNTNVTPENFNLLNGIYSQTNNFFNYRKVDPDTPTESNYPNQIFYTKTKQYGADIDQWTNVSLASVLEMDGDKGEITSLNKLGNQILVFQDTGLAQVLYNESMQITTKEGIPIEIANSGKVQGKKYISSSVGCSNKWSIVTNPNGIYFIDSFHKNLYLYNEQLQDLSSKYGLNSWMKKPEHYSEKSWTPRNFDAFKCYYDELNQDVLLTNKNTTLAFSEKAGAFTSFYDYGATPFFCNFDSTGVWVRNTGNEIKLWKHQGGSNYCSFFGTQKPFSITFIGNQEPQIDKIFTNIEFRATVSGDGTETDNKFTPTLPFTSLEVWNEYQHGYTTLENKNGHSAMVHGGGSSALKRKFRIWRCDIPRDNIDILTTRPILPENPTEEEQATYDANVVKYNQYLEDVQNGIYRISRHPLDRMRNPWLYLKLKKTEGTTQKTEIHDIAVTYFS